MNLLSDNNLTQILEYLSNSPATVANFSCVCVRFNQLLQHNETAWKRLCLLEWTMNTHAKKTAATQGWFKTYVTRKWLQHRWRNSAKMKQTVFEGHVQGICSLTFATITNATGFIKRPTLITGDESGFVIQWDLGTKLPSKQIANMHDTPVVSVQYLDNNVVVTCCSGDVDGAGSNVQFFDAFEGEKTYYSIPDIAKIAEDEYAGKTVAFEAIDSEYTVNANRNVAIVWKRDKSNRTKHAFKLHHTIEVHTYDILCLKVLRGFSGENDEGNDGIVKRHLVVTGSMDGDCCVFDAVTGDIVSMLTGHTGPVTKIHSLENGLVITGSNDCTVRVFEPEKGTCVAVLQGHTRPITSLYAFQRGNTITIAAGAADGSVKIWDYAVLMNTCTTLNTWRQVFKDHRNRVNSIQIDQYRMVTGSLDKTANIYARNHEEIDYTLVHTVDSHLNGINRVLFDDEGRYLAIASGDSVCSLIDYSPLREFNVVKRGTDTTVDEDHFVEPVYDNASHSYMGPPTRSWTMHKHFAKDRKPIEKVEIMPELFKDTFMLYNVLSESECEHFIKETEHVQYEDLYGYHPSYRSNKRVIVQDDELANLVFERVKNYVPKSIDRESFSWESYSVNPHWRFCRYYPGQHFSPHIDGHYEVDRDHRSWFTFMIYLNGGFEGGATNFLKMRSKHVIYPVIPAAGMVLVFPHELYHEGEPLGSLQKYIMRSDLMFEKKEKVEMEQKKETVCVKTENGEEVLICL
jgi:WD40 repeat protein